MEESAKEENSAAVNAKRGRGVRTEGTGETGGRQKIGEEGEEERVEWDIRRKQRGKHIRKEE